MQLNQEDGNPLDLWDIAYQNLREGEDTAKLMEAYEKILTNIHTYKNESGRQSCRCIIKRLCPRLLT